VFLTDFRSQPDGSFVAAARLPRAHRYYNDHLTRPQSHDPIAIFECVRQMLLCAMHLHHGASRETASITAECSLEISEPRALTVAAGYELELLGTVADSRERDGVTTRVVHRVDVRLAGTSVGTITVDTALKAPASYQKLRMRTRTSMPPQSSELVAGEPIARIAAHLLGRSDQANVVLLDPEVFDGTLTSRLRVPVSNPGMFDHSHDHVPGPVMMEAARQAGQLLMTELFASAPSKLVLVELTAQYAQFAELDSDILVRAQPASTGGARRPEESIVVEFVQDDVPVASMRVRLASIATEQAHGGSPARAV
jgi:hypothetical protein